MIQQRIDSSNNISQIAELQELIHKKSSSMSLQDVNSLIEYLKKHKNSLEQTSKAIQMEMLKDFLQEVRKKKLFQLEQLKRELSFVEDDLKRTDKLSLERLKEISKSPGEASIGQTSEVSPHFNVSANKCTSFPLTTSTNVDSTNDPLSASNSVSPEPSSPIQVCPAAFNKQFILEGTLHDCLERKKKILNHNFDLLERCYFTNRNCCSITSSDENSYQNTLLEFNETLGKFTALSKIRTLATLNYDLNSASSIVSTIEFDKDNEFFAIAGVTKKIKLFEYSSVVRDSLEIHYPVIEMEGSSKISCISWNSYIKGLMASSDYEGKVTIWDATTCTKVMNYHQHQKRCWSVDFNKIDTKIIASGSDDATVMLWSTDVENCVAKIDAIANVCSVKFNPCDKYSLAFGSADHCVYYYDLRNTKTAVNIFKEHTKAVSYVKFLDRDELVSASTDSFLKLWSLNDNCCKRSFKGHTNDKNFIGLTTSTDYIGCGSENNSLYVYYKGVSSNVLSHQFDSPRVSSYINFINISILTLIF